MSARIRWLYLNAKRPPSGRAGRACIVSACTQPLLPHNDEIDHVLDYRKVRQIIINECTAEHVNLLETLIGKLANRLMQLPGGRGVRVKIAKLEIFDDCEVAIRMETGQW